MSLRKCKAEHTHREYRTWMAWLDNDLNNPSRNDNYLMALTSEVRYMFTTTSRPSSLEEFKLPFTKSIQPRSENSISKDTQSRAHSKRAWMGMLGFKGKELELTNGNRH